MDAKIRQSRAGFLIVGSKTRHWPSLADVQKSAILEALEWANHDLSRTAELLQISKYRLDSLCMLLSIGPYAGKNRLDTLAEHERKHIIAALQACKWNLTKTASILDTHRHTIRLKMKTYGIQKPERDDVENAPE